MGASGSALVASAGNTDAIIGSLLAVKASPVQFRLWKQECPDEFVCQSRMQQLVFPAEPLRCSFARWPLLRKVFFYARLHIASYVSLVQVDLRFPLVTLSSAVSNALLETLSSSCILLDTFKVGILLVLGYRSSSNLSRRLG